MTMPPLPKPTVKNFSIYSDSVYTKKQMFEYAAAVRAATIEECAKACDGHAADWSAISAWESSHSARDCAAAIRALISSPAR